MVAVWVQTEGRWADARAAFEAAGLRVSGPDAGSDAEVDAVTSWSVQVPVDGGRIGAPTAAVDRVHAVLRAAGITVHVASAHVPRGRRVVRRRYHVYRAGAAGAAGAPGKWRRRWAQLGVRDDGWVVDAPNRIEATAVMQHLAAVAGRDPADLAVRPTWGMPWDDSGMNDAAPTNRGALAILLSAVLASGLVGAAWTLGWPVSALAGSALALAVGFVLAVGWFERGPGFSRPVALAWSVFFAAGGGGLGWLVALAQEDTGVTPLLVMASGALSLAGLWQFLRGANRDALVPWLVPVTVTLTGSVSLLFGRLTYEIYLERFSAGVSDVGFDTLSLVGAALVPVMWTIGTLVTVLGVVGWLRHVHVTTPPLTVPVVVTLALLSGAILAVLRGDDAGERAFTAASRSGAPARYYALQPYFVCVDGSDAVSGYGPRPQPDKPLLLLGVNGDTAVLWDPGSRQSVRLRLDGLFLEAHDPGKPCPVG